MAKIAKQLLDDVSEMIENSAEIATTLDDALLGELQGAGDVSSYEAVSDLAGECLTDLNEHCSND